MNSPSPMVMFTSSTAMMANEPPPPPVKPKPPPRPAQPSSGPKPAPRPEPPPPKPVASGPVTVKLPGGEGITRIDVKCENSPERWRGSFVNGAATIDGVPGEGSDKCYGLLKGTGAPIKIVVAGGKTYSCTIDGTVARCD